LAYAQDILSVALFLLGICHSKGSSTDIKSFFKLDFGERDGIQKP